MKKLLFILLVSSLRLSAGRDVDGHWLSVGMYLKSNQYKIHIKSEPFYGGQHTSTIMLGYKKLTSLSGIANVDFYGVQKLDFRGNKLSSLEPLADRLPEKNYSIEEIDVRDNDITILPLALLDKLDKNFCAVKVHCDSTIANIKHAADYAQQHLQHVTIIIHPRT